MSIEVMRYVWNHSKAKANHRLMLLAIADIANDTGDAYPGVDRLADKCVVSHRTAQECIQELERALELQVFENVGTKTKSGWTNLYRILMQGIEQSEVRTPDGEIAKPRPFYPKKTRLFPKAVQPAAPLKNDDDYQKEVQTVAPHDMQLVAPDGVQTVAPNSLVYTSEQPSDKNTNTTTAPSGADEKLEFDMTILKDVVSNIGFKFSQPEQLKSKSNQRNVKRIDTIVSIVTEAFPTFSDSQLAAVALRFYNYWGAKIINGTRASMPLNADTFGNRWREWLETQADLRSINRIQTPTPNAPPVPLPPPIEDDEPLPSQPAFALFAKDVPEVFCDKWRVARDLLHQQLPRELFYPWIAEVQLAASDGVAFWFMAKSKMQADKLSGLSREIKRVLKDVTGESEIDLRFDVPIANLVSEAA